MRVRPTGNCTVLPNLLVTTAALDYRTGIETAFADESVAELLGVDTEAEAPLAPVPVGAGANATNTATSITVASTVRGNYEFPTVVVVER